jgi:hypothetical protein
MTTSAGSPRLSDWEWLPGNPPSDGPRVVISLWPVSRSNAGTAPEYAWIETGGDHHLHIGCQRGGGDQQPAMPVTIASHCASDLAFIIPPLAGLWRSACGSMHRAPQCSDRQPARACPSKRCGVRAKARVA